MANQELVNYIESQIKLGVSKEAVKQALVSAGWGSKDIDDAMNEAVNTSASAPKAESVGSPVSEGLKTSSPKSQNVSPSGKPEPSASLKENMPPVVSSNMFQQDDLQEFRPNGAAGEKADEAQKIHGDQKPSIEPIAQIKNPAVFSETGEAAARAKSVSPVANPAVSLSIKKQSSMWKILTAIFAVVSAGLLILGGFLYKNNSDLKKELDGAQSRNLSLQSKVSNLNSDVSNLKSRISELDSKNKSLSSQLLFFAAPSSTPEEEITASIKGVLSGGKNKLYKVVSDMGVEVYIKNEKEIKSVLDNFIGKEIEISGTHMPGSQDMSVVSINGKSISELSEESATSTSPEVQ